LPFFVHLGIMALAAERPAIIAPPLAQVPLQRPFQDRRAAMLAVLHLVIAGWAVVVDFMADGEIANYSYSFHCFTSTISTMRNGQTCPHSSHLHDSYSDCRARALARYGQAKGHSGSHRH